MFLLCHRRVLEQIYTPVDTMSRNASLETGAIPESEVTATGFEPTTT